MFSGFSLYIYIMRPGARFLHSLFEVTHVEFQTYDVINHKLVFSSGIAHQLLGYPEHELVDLSGDFYKSIVHPEDYPIMLETIKKIMQAKDGEVIEMTIRDRRIDGQYIWVSSRQMIYQRTPDGKVCSIIREAEDVTELVELQGELEQKIQQLKVISYKNSHLLRSPVANIIGLVSLIEEHAITSERNRQIYQYLKEAIIKLDEVIHEINDAARVG